MSIVSIEEAILSFVKKVKDDPGLSDLFRAALNELHDVLDPPAAEAEPSSDQGEPEPAQPTEAQPAPLDDQSGFAGQDDPPPADGPTADLGDPPAEPSPAG